MEAASPRKKGFLVASLLGINAGDGAANAVAALSSMEGLVL